MGTVMKENVLLVFCTSPDFNEAKSISHILVEKKLAACCNIIPNVSSIYQWQGKIEESQEALMLIKTTQKKYDQLEKEIKMMHSYSVPEIIAANIETGSRAYIDWIMESIKTIG
jgi:periplasmic divalent cation tolerance protein